MSADAAQKLITAEEFCEFVHRPENADRWFELVRGEVIELPPPLKRHGLVCGNVVWVLNSYVRQQRKGYVTSNDAGVILERGPDTVRGPDAAVYDDAENWDEVHPKYGEVPPRLAVEVLSPDDRPNKVNRKIVDYLRAGVGLVWLIDPDERNVTVYRPERVPYVVTEADELTGEDVLPELRVRVSELFFVPGE